jgi:ectoine hydroxylase-related dioxygenase (phytanoyl-CoA dioxygenase family)
MHPADPVIDPTDLDLDLWREQGFIRLGRIATGDELEVLRAEERRFRLGVGYGAADNQSLRVNIQLCHRSEAVRRFCTEGPQVAAMLRLLGPDVCLTHQQFVTKLPDGETQHSDIPMHQDNGYGRLDPMTDVTVWMPLVDTGPGNGGLRIVPGSQRLGLLEHGASAVNPVLLEAQDLEESISLALGAGEAVAFTGLTLHGSGPNHSGQDRPALFVRYCEPGASMDGPGPGERRLVLEDPHSWMVAGQA